MNFLERDKLISYLRSLIPIKIKIFFLRKNYNEKSVVYKILGITMFVQKIRKYGLKFENLNVINLNQIRFSNPIVCEMIKSKSKEVLKVNDNKFNFKINHSIHYDLFNKINNNKKNLINSRYAKWQMYLNKKKINQRDLVFIKNKIEKAKNNFFSIKKYGQITNDINKLPIILSKPLLKSRYNFKVKQNKKIYFEVYDGHHRLAVMRYLKFKRVFVIVCKDVANKTPFGISLKSLNEK